MLSALERWLRNANYAPKLPWKKGELAVYKTTPDFINDSTLPIFLIPPAGSFDHDAQRILSPADHIRSFGPRLFEARKSRPVFVDAVYLDDDRHKAAFNVHPLTALLERARLGSAQAWPLTRYGRSDEYQQAVAKAHLVHGYPVAMEINLADLGSASLAIRLKSLCNQVSCDPHDAVLIIDCGPILVTGETQEADFASTLINVLNELPHLYEWAQIVLSATSLGEVTKIKPRQTRLIRRSEWHIYRNLYLRRREILRLPIFSDYGVEYRENLNPIKARPSAKLGYTTETSTFFVKGENVKTGGYEAIYPVAETVARSNHFMGSRFSQGDARISAWERRQARTGDAPSWRWAASDHHHAVIGKSLRSLMGLPTAEITEVSAEATQDLFSLAAE